MSGIIHKESLPAQSLIKRRRVDTQATTGSCSEDRRGDDDEKRVDNVAKGEAGENGATCLAGAPSGPCSSFAQTENASSSSDDDDDQIELESAGLAELRAPRSRRQQEQPRAGGSASSSSAQSSANVPAGPDTTPPPSALKAHLPAPHTNSYDHDVLFRNVLWRSPSKAGTAEEKRKQSGPQC
ncbi:hypothetical protein LSCM1_02624 [Leishmania martiniquensis]|uniref:Uncharacterized protein n=1 Tax=Leishmania martiniquensis TaxID=1580590 RepID=A0A836FU76_9TRYP|nr:hypothetical protein LSCM1_02624 [Leishmania martiniquensis]